MELGTLAAVGGDVAQGEALLRRALDVDPGHAGALNGLGNLALFSGDLTGAADLYRRAGDVSPRPVEARYNLAMVQARLGRCEDARREAAALRGELEGGQAKLGRGSRRRATRSPTPCAGLAPERRRRAAALQRGRDARAGGHVPLREAHGDRLGAGPHEGRARLHRAVHAGGVRRRQHRDARRVGDRGGAPERLPPLVRAQDHRDRHLLHGVAPATRSSAASVTSKILMRCPSDS